MRLLGKAVLAGVIVLVLLQVVRPGIWASGVHATAELQAPPEVRRVIEKDCFSCHSDERRLAWFDEIVPAYWLVRHDILKARARLNFSTLGAKPAAVQKGTLYEAVNMMQMGAMPLPQFTRLHPEARVTPEELATLRAYLNPWAAAGTGAAAGAKSDAVRVSLASVGAEWNGLAFDPAFESWKPISTTERGDNHTFRFILANDTAWQAVQAGKISPWPDGAKLAKIAWQREAAADGLVYPGKFVQVELMVKNAGLYRDAEGWGWGRWRGLDLKPYGTDAAFVEECTTCHLPVRGNDNVYTLPMTAAKVSGNEVVNNHAAALPASLPYAVLSWNAITMYVDPKTETTATLYGNDDAMRAVRAGVTYAPGSLLGLVTWGQREDPHWFGARIPDAVRSVEFVTVAEAGQQAGYRRFAGAGLVEDRDAAGVAAERFWFVTRLKRAELP